jgi:hypothetical protein
MSVELSTVTPDPVSPAGKVWQSMVSDLLAAEFDRRKTLEGRGATLMTASVSLVTLIFALTVILTGKDHVFANRYAVYFLLAALVSFVISAVIAIVVQTRGFNYDVIKRQTLKRLTDPNAPFWDMSTADAVRADVSQHVKTICSLRDGNDSMATRLTWSLRAQLAAIILLSVSIALELYGTNLLHDLAHIWHALKNIASEQQR